MKSNSRSVSVLVLLAIVPLVLASCHSSGQTPDSSSSAPKKMWEFPTGQLPQVPRGDYYDDQSPAIAEDGTIYAPGSTGLYAVHPDGTQKWFYRSPYQSPHFPQKLTASLAAPCN